MTILMHVYEIDGREWIKGASAFEEDKVVFIPVETERLVMSASACRDGAIGQSVRQVEA